MTEDGRAGKEDDLEEVLEQHNSRATITVAETSLVARAYIGSWYDFLFSRGVLPAPINVPNGGQLRAQYIIELTYPA